MPIDEWHEDDGPCLFIAFKEGDFYDCDWTSPITYTPQGRSFADIYNGCEEIYFKKIRVHDDDLKLVRASHRAPLLHAFGNAIVPEVAARFIKATM